MTLFERNALRIVLLVIAFVVAWFFADRIYWDYLGTTRSVRLVDRKLKQYDIAPLPTSAKVLGHEEHYNIFHAWFYLKVSMDKNSLHEYEARLPFEKLIIGNEKGMVRILNENEFDAFDARGFASSPNAPQIHWREEIGDWWDTKAIADGVMYRHVEKKPGFQRNTFIYVDRGRNLIYVAVDS